MLPNRFEDCCIHTKDEEEGLGLELEMVVEVGIARWLPVLKYRDREVGCRPINRMSMHMTKYSRHGRPTFWTCHFCQPSH